MNHPTPLKKGVWHHIALTTDSKNTVLYVDGKPHRAAKMRYENNSGQLCVGTPTDPYWKGFTGALDDLRLYQTALTEAQVRGLYTGAIPAPSVIAERKAKKAALYEAPLALLETERKQGRAHTLTKALTEALDEQEDPQTKAAYQSVLAIAKILQTREISLRDAYKKHMNKKVTVLATVGKRRGVLTKVDETGLSLKVESVINGQVQNTSFVNLTWAQLSDEEREKRIGAWTPANSEECIAAYLSGAFANAAAGKALLAEAKDHPLTPLLQKRAAHQKSE